MMWLAFLSGCSDDAPSFAADLALDGPTAVLDSFAIGSLKWLIC